MCEILVWDNMSNGQYCIVLCRPPWRAALQTRPVSAAEASSPAQWRPSGHESYRSQWRHQLPQQYQWLFQRQCLYPKRGRRNPSEGLVHRKYLDIFKLSWLFLLSISEADICGFGCNECWMDCHYKDSQRTACSSCPGWQLGGLAQHQCAWSHWQTHLQGIASVGGGDQGRLQTKQLFFWQPFVI